MKRDFLRCLAGAAAGVLLTGTSTFAADLGVAPLAPLPVFTWTGIELGVQVGGGAGRTTVHVDGNSAPFPAFPSSDAYGSSGVFGGIHVGFNYQLTAPIVAGVQLEYNFAGITGNAIAPPLNFASTSIRQFGSADARLGVAFDRLLIYAIGGFAYADIRNQIQLQGLSPGVIDFFAVNRYGFDVGGGLEYNFYGNWTARAEYRYYDWGTRGFNSPGFGSPVNTAIIQFAIPNHSSRETLQTGRIGLTYKFGWPYAGVVARY
ncbi:MAG: outer membrane beta-barrel protein [Pseudomonadota bacterium]|nr:outer membrane beta-barrel protein [Pseudomonadota bacterium]